MPRFGRTIFNKILSAGTPIVVHSPKSQQRRDGLGTDPGWVIDTSDTAVDRAQKKFEAKEARRNGGRGFLGFPKPWRG